MNNISGERQPPGPDLTLTDAAASVDKIVSPILYVFGFPGNICAFIVWIQPRMRHSSGIYLATLAVADLLFLVFHVFFEFYKVWNIQMFDAPVLCELFPVIFMATQYVSPLLVLAFTVERFIAICLPTKRQTYCTPLRAKIVGACLTVLSFSLASMQAYFYQYNKSLHFCGIRHSAVSGGTLSFWSIWTWITEMLVFMFVPLLILLFNVLIIREVKRHSDFDSSFKAIWQTTTFSLLVVSFYFIITTFPVSIVYAIRYYFMPSADSVIKDANSLAKYLLAKTIIEEIGITHFACKFYLFLITERLFRDEFVNVVRRFVCFLRKDTVGYVQQTENTANTDWHETEMTPPVPTEETNTV